MNSPVCVGDFIRVGRYSRAGLIVDGSDTFVRIDQSTTFQLVAPDENPRSLIEILSGALHFISRIRHSLEVRTPFMNAAVEGTEFMVRVEPDRASVILYEGAVVAGNDKGEVRLAGEQAAVAIENQSPRFVTLARPQDAVQWTLHYQPILFAIPEAAFDLKQTMGALRQGDIQGAFERLEREIQESRRDASFYSFRAGLFLLVGRVEEAKADLNQARRLDEENGVALALEAMIAVANGFNQQAFDLASRSVQRNAGSAVGWIAFSYAQQARFDLNGALSSIEKALVVDPDNPYARARQAELRLSVGDLEGAVAAANSAVARDPDIALTQTVLGFSCLVKVELESAERAFKKAMALDQSDALPHVGLGLALIRDGRLEAGRRELEIATILEPRNALVRSYMGKAYYEERRDRLASVQYGMAKEQDPHDPTPWYYEAMLLQQSGQPVEALQSLQKSQALNDNRAVYRSRLLLDQDLAARSAGVGRIYRDLGFEQLALLEGWNSLDADPGDYSGHRLLADTYTHLPRHEMARVSELLQAQLLQPVNSAPLQPLMAETALYIPDGLGPSAAAFNEYTPLFHRNGLRALGSVLYGSHDTIGEEILLSGVEGDFSFSLGQYYFETDGYRINHDLKLEIQLGFLQANLSHKTSVQVEGRRSRKRYGDLDSHFYEDSVNSQLRNREDMDLVRLGLHHRFNPGSQLIASLIHEQGESTWQDQRSLTQTLGSDIENETWSAEVRQLWSREKVRATAGIGYLDADVSDLVTTAITIPTPLVTQSSRDLGGRQINAYLYSWIDLGRALTLNLGGSYDDWDGSQFDRKQFNPKMGLVLRLTPDTSLRAAAFRTLHRPVPAYQTIEPIEVAGFNQFFDGINGERVTRQGIALDHCFSKDLAAGAELSKRNRKFTVSRFEPTGVQLSQLMTIEKGGRAYFYWTPNRKSALALEYFYDRFREETLWDTTHRFPLSLSYFGPAGFSGTLRPSYVRQSGLFRTGGGNESSNFWNLDFLLHYRLPQRRGQISLEARNLLGERFRYKNHDGNLPLFTGERTVALRLSLNL